MAYAAPHGPEVLIVGAGPTGLMLAALLTRWGAVPRIIDSNSHPSVASKATGVQSRTLEAFQQLGLSDAAVAQGLPGYSVNLHNDQGLVGRMSFGDAGKTKSPFPYILILPQDRTEAILGGDLQARGVTIEWNTTLESFTQTESGVQVTTRQRDRVSTARYRYLLGADGARSAVRKGLDMPFQGETYDHLFFVADLRIDGTPVQGELNIFLSSVYKFVAMFPMKGSRRFRLVGVVPEQFQHLEHPTFDDLQPYFKEKLEPQMRLSDVAWFATYRVHHRVADRFKQGDVFLLGDAAHVHSPVGGQGMNTGLQDAYNLAWKLALVLRGEADERLLETYHEERHPNAVKLVNTTDRIFSGFIASEQGWVGVVRRWVLPALLPAVMKTRQAQRRGFDLLSQTALNYRSSSLSVDHPGHGIAAGDRFPWFRVDGVDVFTRLSPTRFTLFAVGDWSSHSGEIEALRSTLVNVVTLRDPSVSNRTGLERGLYLVRPDGYVGLTATGGDQVRAYLEATLRRHEEGSGAGPI